MGDRNHANAGTFAMGNYDFCLFRIPEHGGRILWQITNVCNYYCSYCIFASGPEKINGELSTAKIIKAVNELKEQGFTHIKFTGGEPFVRHDLVDILQHACNLRMVVDVSTNASFITEDKAKRLASMGLNMVHVSIDGHTKKIHEEVRGGKTYEKTLQGLNHLVEQGMYVRVGTVLFSGNDQCLREMIVFCAERGVKEVAFSIMEPAGRIAGDYSSVTQINKQNLRETIEALAREYGEKIKVRHNFMSHITWTGEGTCPGARKFLYIDNVGRIAPCTWVVEKSNIYQSNLTLETSSVSDILASEPIKSYLSMIGKAGEEGYHGCPLQWKKNL